MLLIAPWTSVPWDVATWYHTSQNAYLGYGLYGQPGFSYPPVYGYWLATIGEATRLLNASDAWIGRMVPAFQSTLPLMTSYITSPSFNLIAKLPLIASVPLSSWFVWDIAKLYGVNRSRARLAVLAWCLNPLVIFTAAVHGQIDPLVSLCVIVSVWARVRHRFSWSGAAIALGVLTKVSPGVLIPLILVSLIFPAIDEEGFNRVQAIRKFITAGIATTLIVLAPLVIAGQIGEMLTNVFTRASTNSTVGGLSWTGAKFYTWFNPLANWARNHPAGVGRFYEFSVAISSSAGAALWLNRRRNGIMSVVTLSAGVFSLYLFIEPVTNPQYLLWPSILASVLVAFYPWRVLPLLWLGAAGILYVGGLFGWMTLLSPFIVHTHIVSLSSVVRSMAAMYFQPGPSPSSSAGAQLTHFAWMLVAPALLIATLYLLGNRRVASRVPLLGIDESQRPNRYALFGLVGISLTALVPPAIISPVPSPSIAVAVRASRAGRVSLDLSLKPFSLAQTLLAFPVIAQPKRKSVLFYTGTRYPYSGSSLAATTGVYDHLISDLKGYGYPLPSIVTSSRLPSVLLDLKDAPTRAIVMTNGTLPDIIYGSHLDLLRPWMEAGGTLFWSGDVLGYYSVAVNQTIFQTSENVTLEPGNRVVGFVGISDLLGRPGIAPLTNYWGRVATEQTSLSKNLGDRYQLDHAGLIVNAVLSRGGLVLGPESAGTASVSYLPVGRGGIIYFGGRTAGTSEAAMIAKVLVSGLTAAKSITFSAILSPSRSGRVFDINVPRNASTGALMQVVVMPYGDVVEPISHQLVNLDRKF